MANDLSLKPQTIGSFTATQPGWAITARENEPAHGMIVGSLTKFNRGEWTALGNKLDPADVYALRAPIPLFWQRFKDGLPIYEMADERGMLKDRQELGDLDPAQWPEAFGQKPDPWKKTFAMLVSNTKTGGKFTYLGSTAGAHVARRELTDAIADVQMNHPAAFPLLKLGSVTMPSKQFGPVPRPFFEIVEWRGADGPACRSEEVMNDDLPF